MTELNFHSSSIARSLRVGDTNTIGLVIPDNSNPHFAEIARFIEDEGFKCGYSVILCNSDNDIDKQAAYINVLIAKKVDGVILISTNNTPDHLYQLTSAGVPTVVVDREVDMPLVDTVLTNSFKGGYLAAAHLLDLGHRKIACITGPSDLTSSADRVKGYRKALKQWGIEVCKDYILRGDFLSPSGEKAADQLLSLADPPSAIFACNDMMAIGALKAIRLANLRVPEDISLVGYDDIQITSAISPPLTTIAQPRDKMAAISIELLLARMKSGDHDNTPRRFVLNPRLTKRESSAQFQEQRIHA
jgi:LacI family transcriptional regulator